MGVDDPFLREDETILRGSRAQVRRQGRRVHRQPLRSRDPARPVSANMPTRVDVCGNGGDTTILPWPSEPSGDGGAVAACDGTDLIVHLPLPLHCFWTGFKWPSGVLIWVRFDEVGVRELQPGGETPR